MSNSILSGMKQRVEAKINKQVTPPESEKTGTINDIVNSLKEAQETPEAKRLSDLFESQSINTGEALKNFSDTLTDEQQVRRTQILPEDESKKKRNNDDDGAPSEPELYLPVRAPGVKDENKKTGEHKITEETEPGMLKDEKSMDGLIDRARIEAQNRKYNKSQERAEQVVLEFDIKKETEGITGPKLPGE